MAHHFSRKELFELVWSESRVALSKRLGVSDVGLAKACLRANIPMPPRGYWAKKETGKAVKKPAFPARGMGQSDHVSVGPQDYRHTSDEDKIVELPPPPLFSESADGLRARARAMLGKVKVPKTLDSPHRLIGSLLEEDERRRKEAERNRYYWKKPLFDTPQAKRRLRIINAIFFALANAGCKATLRGKEDLEPNVQIGDVYVSFKLEISATKSQRGSHTVANKRNESGREMLKLTVHQWNAPADVPYEWEDRDALSLEDQIAEIAAGIIVLGEMNYRAGELHRYQWLVDCKQEKEEKARQRQQKEEQEALERKLKDENDRRGRLFSEAANLVQAAHIRQLVTAMEHHPDMNGCSQIPIEFTDWKIWALSEADRIDPMRCSLKEVIGS
jgi:hypothetical protein